jgi:hypothetical protein
MVQQGGKAKLFVIGKTVLKDHVRANVSFDAMIVTDEQSGYSGLINEYRGHVTINHSMLEFKKDGFSTNAVEGFFSHFKRMVIGTYHQLSEKHLDRYCQEHAYRFNTRKIKDNVRFFDVMSKTTGRLRYKDLVGIKPPPKPKYKSIDFINGD